MQPRTNHEQHQQRSSNHPTTCNNGEARFCGATGPQIGRNCRTPKNPRPFHDAWGGQSLQREVSAQHRLVQSGRCEVSPSDQFPTRGWASWSWWLPVGFPTMNGWHPAWKTLPNEWLGHKKSKLFCLPLVWTSYQVRSLGTPELEISFVQIGFVANMGNYDYFHLGDSLSQNVTT